MNADPVAELVESARAVNEYLGGFEDQMKYRSAVYRTRAQQLREEADAIERKEAAIARFREALRAMP